MQRLSVLVDTSECNASGYVALRNRRRECPGICCAYSALQACRRRRTSSERQDEVRGQASKTDVDVYRPGCIYRADVLDIQRSVDGMALLQHTLATRNIT